MAELPRCLMVPVCVALLALPVALADSENPFVHVVLWERDGSRTTFDLPAPEAAQLAEGAAVQGVGAGTPLWVALGLRSSSGAGFHWSGVTFDSSCPSLEVEALPMDWPGAPGLPPGPLTHVTATAQAGFANASLLLVGEGVGEETGVSTTETLHAARVESLAFRLEQAGVVCFGQPPTLDTPFSRAWIIGDGVVHGCAEILVCQTALR